MAADLVDDFLDAGLVSNQLDRLVGFYNGVLGFPLAGSIDIPDVGRITHIGIGRSVLRILVPVAAAAEPPAGAGFASAVGIRYLSLKIANLTETVDRISAAGFRVAVPIRTLRPGVRVALVEDPDGNTVELMEESQP
jgi:catechol 2,3-dioxygenase-like lactoylglutathione lyase family enzyme